MNRYQDWLEQAERDLRKAEIDLRYEFWEWVCFTAQQAAEKAVKAFLIKRGDSVWGHAITPMLRSLEGMGIPPVLLEHAQMLDAYFIPTRYPNGFAQGKPADYYNRRQAQEALDAAGEILRFCKDHIDRSP
jgi:HEPN domain-containing protein